MKGGERGNQDVPVCKESERNYWCDDIVVEVVEKERELKRPRSWGRTGANANYRRKIGHDRQ